MKLRLIVLSIIVHLSSCRDYYAGMFKKNDMLVASDTIYKEKNPFGFTVASYGRSFKCPITYFRVSDRIGVRRTPRVQITRGGLRIKYLTLKLTASYGQPINVNIYVGCENKMKITTAKKGPAATTTKQTAVKTEITTPRGASYTKRPQKSSVAPPSDATLSDTALSASTSPDAAPTDVAQTDAAPTEAAPTDAAPTDAAPTDAAPTDTALTDAAPTDAAPTDTAPTDTTPTDTTPTDAAPTDAAPTDAAK